MTSEQAAFTTALAATLTSRRPDRLSIELIASTPDDGLTELVFETLWRMWEEDFACDTAQLLASLPEGARCLYLTSIAEGQVLNGGFAQLYQNGYGRQRDDMVRAFDYFSAAKYAALMREANKVYGKNRLRIWIFSGRTGQLQRKLFQRDLLPSMLPDLENLDSRFYEDEGELGTFRVAKIRATPDSFVLRSAAQR